MEVVGLEIGDTPLMVVVIALEEVVVVVGRPSGVKAVAGWPSFLTFGQFVESILNCD